MIHNYEKTHLRTLELLEKSTVSSRNKELILGFHSDLVLEGLSKPRLCKYLVTMRSICKILCMDLDKAKIEDIKKLVSGIQQNNYSHWTKASYKIIIRRFYQWHLGMKGKGNYPELVKWISIRVSKSERKLPCEGDLLNEEDVSTLLNKADHPRDKALVSMLWESGARIGEIGNLQLKHLQFDKHGIVVTVRGKTGSRKIRLITSTPYVANWLSMHPQKDEKDASLWTNIGTTNRNKPMNYPSIRKLLQLLFEKAGIKKKSNPHLFRHSRATHMAHFLTEFQMNQYFGWEQGSDMPSTYVHMSGKDVERAILAMNGIAQVEKKERVQIKPKVCPRCDTINSHDTTYCKKCAGILDEKLALEMDALAKERTEMDNVMSMLMKDMEVQKFLLEKLKALGSD